MRGKSERFAEHYNQATLFWNSQTDVEKAHILRGFRFELTKVQTPAIRERVVSMLTNVDEGLASSLAAELGIDMPPPMPRVLEHPPTPEIVRSPALSLFARPGNGGIRARRIAILVADGVDGDAARAIHAGLAELGGVPRYVGARLGSVKPDKGDPIDVEVTFETMPSVLFDAVAIPGGKAAIKRLGNVGHCVEFLKDQYRHAKAIFALGAGVDLVQNATIPDALPSGERDPGVVTSAPDVANGLPQFVRAIARHRHHEREMDPPEV